MSTLRLILGIGTILGINSQVRASEEAADVVPRDRVMAASVLTLEEARALCEQGLDLRIQGKFKESFEATKQAADAGWKWAQYTTGSMYLGGVGTDIDIESAFDYYELCCDEIAEAANQIVAIYGGVFTQAYEYENGEKALEYYKKAADLGLPVGKDNYKRLKQALEIK